MHTQGRLEHVTREFVRVRCQQILKNAQFQGQKTLPEQMRVELKQFFKHRSHCSKPVAGFGCRWRSEWGAGCHGDKAIGCGRRGIGLGFSHGLDQLE